MAYENLLKSVEESARERERELNERAEHQAEQIRTDAARQADEIRKNAVMAAEKSATVERNKQLYLAKGAIKEEGIHRRSKVFEAAFGEAEKSLAGLRKDTKYPAVFERLAREAIGAMGDREFVVHIDKRDEALCKKVLSSLKAKPEIVPDLASMGGLVASTPDGLIVVANTIEARLERIREHKKLEIHAILAGG